VVVEELLGGAAVTAPASCVDLHFHRNDFTAFRLVGSKT
jgi:hypothetical protein